MDKIGFKESLKTSIYIVLISVFTDILGNAIFLIYSFFKLMKQMAAPDAIAFSTGIGELIINLLIFLVCRTIVLCLINLTFMGKIASRKARNNESLRGFFLVSWSVIILMQVPSFFNGSIQFSMVIIVMYCLFALATYRILAKKLRARILKSTV